MNLNRIIVVTAQTALRLNITFLEKLGEVVYLYDEYERTPNVFNFGQLAVGIHEKLRAIEFDPEQDIVALVGKQVHIAALFYVLGFEYGYVNVAVYDSATERYIKKEICPNAFH